MPNPETVLTHRIVQTIQQAYPDAWVFKVHGSPYQQAGVPDLLVVVVGRLVGLEVKCPRPGESDDHARGRATPLQLEQLDRLRRAGAVADVILTPQEALDVIGLVAPAHSSL